MSVAEVATVPVRPVEGVELVAAALTEEAGGERVDNERVHALVTANGGTRADPAWLERIGVRERWWTGEPGGERLTGAPTTEDLLTSAAAAALDRAGLRPDEVEVLIAATTTPSRLTSSMATVVSGRLGIRGMAFELRAGCPSALHALAVGYSLLSTGATTVLVTAAETLSRVAPGTGPLPYLAADGGGAVVLARTGRKGSGLRGGVLGNDGSLADRVGAPGRLPPTAADLDADRYRLEFGDGYQDAASAAWRQVPCAGLTAVGASPGEISAMVANQPGRPRVHEAAIGAGLDPSVAVDVMARTANSGSASFMAALTCALERRTDGAPHPLLLASVGGGLSYGALVVDP